VGGGWQFEQGYNGLIVGAMGRGIGQWYTVNHESFFVEGVEASSPQDFAIPASASLLF